jgi:hypothetical protein
MDSHENFANNNDNTYDDTNLIEDMKSINITNKSEAKKPLNEYTTNLHKISESINIYSYYKIQSQSSLNIFTKNSQ